MCHRGISQSGISPFTAVRPTPVGVVRLVKSGICLSPSVSADWRIASQDKDWVSVSCLSSATHALQTAVDPNPTGHPFQPDPTQSLEPADRSLRPPIPFCPLSPCPPVPTETAGPTPPSCPCPPFTQDVPLARQIPLSAWPATTWNALAQPRGLARHPLTKKPLRHAALIGSPSCPDRSLWTDPY